LLRSTLGPPRIFSSSSKMHGQQAESKSELADWVRRLLHHTIREMVWDYCKSRCQIFAERRYSRNDRNSY
jgi:hypothetical protein